MAKITPPKGAPGQKFRTDFGEVVRAHQRYRLPDGTIVPGVTTITGIIAKPALVEWSAEMERAEIDHGAYREAAAEVGRLVHEKIRAKLDPDYEVDLSKYRPYFWSLAETAYRRFETWWDQKRRLEGWLPFTQEEQLVNINWRYGGTIDALFIDGDGELHLVDFKTATGVYKDMFIQVAGGYRHLVLENYSQRLASTRILHLSRDGDDFDAASFAEYVFGEEDERNAWLAFRAAHDLYELCKPLRRAENTLRVLGGT